MTINTTTPKIMTMQDRPSGEATYTDAGHTIEQVGQRLSMGVAERDRLGVLPPEVFEELRASGLTALLVPVEVGGSGATFAETGAMLRQLGRHDPATAVTLSMHTHLVAAQVWRYHRAIPGAQAVLEKVVGGAVLISTGASDWLPSNGTVTRVADGYRVSARKSPASGCEAGQVLVTSARWEGGPDGPSVIHFAVPMNAPGVSIERTWDTLGLRASGSHTVVLQDVFVPDAAVSLIRPADRWHPVWNTVLGVALPLIMAAYLGIADRAATLARASAAKASGPHALYQLGNVLNAHTIANDVVGAMLGEADNLRFDATDEYAARTLSRKTVAAEAIIETVRLALEVVGGCGFTRSHEMERLLRDAHGALFHPLPKGRQLLLSANVALGLSPAG
ncbi:MAG: acyl-CoA dehydrogenase family protein [Acidimicrobiales bacterium]